ncbi:carcinoembryonic antigen-related cell adhesion molecule 5-like [Sardina pilchardus]|uniref:carcinoembryonic antigen-related cell adhesion molecule 5-like n=1 Tax=Sardina pilchardus TaxID=27697 RepID=UPI002E0FE3F7
MADKLVVQMSNFHKNESIECTAVNVLTGKTENKTMIIHVTDPISVLPISSTPPIADSSYALKCVGAPQNANIQWTKDGNALSTSGRVQLSDNNAILTFDLLSNSDTGVYQCVANEQGSVVPGVPYKVEVIYGPLHAEITVSGDRAVGKTTLLLPGNSATFYCSAQCNPACDYEWFLNGNMETGDANFSISSVDASDVGVLACAAYNPLTQNTTVVETNIELIDGPKNVIISGPNSVQVGVKATFECSAVCSPSCVYTWEVYGRTLSGSTVDLTISKYVATETLVCIAQNVVSGKLVGATKTIDVTDPNWCGC